MVRWRIGLITLAVVAAIAWLSVGEVMAGPIDPIVRVKVPGIGSIPIPAPLPFMFDFGTFPSPPDPSNCYAGTEGGMNLVGCYFQNQTGMTISFLQLMYALGSDPGGLVFTVEDPDGLFAASTANASAATFTGGGEQPGIPTCTPGDGYCYGGDFVIELVGFPDGTTTEMTASTPDPGATLLLFGMGLAGLTAFRRWRG